MRVGVIKYEGRGQGRWGGLGAERTIGVYWGCSEFVL